MKKLIGFIGAWGFFYIGDWACRLSCKKYFNVEDEKSLRFRTGYWLAGVYQDAMNYSVKIQDWAKLKRPWGEPKVKSKMYLNKQIEKDDLPQLGNPPTGDASHGS